MKTAIFAAIVSLAMALPATAQEISGTVKDSLGAVVPRVQVEALDGQTAIASGVTDDVGRYRLSLKNAGRYRVRATAPTFAVATSDACYAVADRTTTVDLTLFPAVAQEVVVTATGTPIPEMQTGASISVIEAQDLDAHGDLHQSLRLEPGIQLDQTGQTGAATYLYVRGGPSTSNKVLIDGVPANDIGGAIDFGILQSNGISDVEVFRGPNSALFGSDALASVVNVTTRRGVTPLPELTYAVDGGTFGTYHQEASLGGAWKGFDYFSDLSRFDTQNSMPNSADHNLSYLGNFGYRISPGASVRGTLRRTVNGVNDANAIDVFGIPDDGVNRAADTSFGLTLDLKPTKRWHTVFRYGALRFNYRYLWYGPTGIPYNSAFAGLLYLGTPMTIRGANGYVVSPQLISQLPAGEVPDDPGQAVFQYPGNNNYANQTNRDFGYIQSDYHVSSTLNLLAGFRYEDERGGVNSAYLQGATQRGNYSYTLQAQGGLWARLFYTVGSGIEDNALFGWATAPRASLAYYLFRPSQSEAFSGTKIRFNFGKGIQEPSIPQQLGSLYSTLQSLPGGSQTVAQYNVQPFLAETSRTYDGGLEQELLGGKARLAVTYFHNEFGDQAEYVPNTALLSIVSPSLANYVLTNDPYGYIYANTLAYRAQGVELEGAWQVRRSLRVRGGWTHVKAVVQSSFSSSALAPVTNPLFPNVPIGADSPLVGAQPFGVAPNYGYMGVEFQRSRWFASLTGSFVSRRDDSDYLSDTFFGDTLLLPNHNLDPAYQKLDLYGSYQVSRRVAMYAMMGNLLNQHYQEIIGYPALPFTIRAGMKITFGGESWHRKQ